MALVPWILKNGEKRTVVDRDCDFKQDGNAVLVVQFDSQQFSEKRLENELCTNASYDLRVGNLYRMYSELSETQLNQGETIEVPPLSGLIVYTLELVRFPDNICGLVLPRESLLRKGLSNETTKVDPGYGPGRLNITVFNKTREKQTLKYGEPFCALELFQVAKGIIPYRKGVPSGRGILPKKPRLPRVQKWLSTNWYMVLISGTALVGLIISIIK